LFLTSVLCPNLHSLWFLLPLWFLQPLRCDTIR
jgi:hypothetical protein